METAISIKNLGVLLGGKRVLTGVSVRLPEGKITGILGPSGAGKTTLMRVIVGLQKTHEGSVEIFGRPAGSPDLRREIGYMTQAVSVYPDLTLAENLRFFAVMTKAPKHRVEEVLDEVDLRPQAKQLVGTLSGGQQSRASLAIALLAKPRLLVLDEPTVGLDPVLRKRLWEQFHDLKDQGSTILVTSHVMDEASHCDELVLLRGGKLLAHGEPKELVKQSHTRSVEESFIKLVEAVK